MKKAQITVSYDEEKLAAITMYLEEKGAVSYTHLTLPTT